MDVDKWMHILRKNRIFTVPPAVHVKSQLFSPATSPKTPYLPKTTVST